MKFKDCELSADEYFLRYFAAAAMQANLRNNADMKCSVASLEATIKHVSEANVKWAQALLDAIKAHEAAQEREGKK